MKFNVEIKAMTLVIGIIVIGIILILRVQQTRAAQMVEVPMPTRVVTPSQPLTNPIMIGPVYHGTHDYITGLPDGSVEIVSYRGKTTKTFVTPDGKVMSMVGSQPLHYEKNGQLKDIDPRWKAAEKPWDYKMVDAEYQAFVKEEFGEEEILRLEKKGNFLSARPEALTIIDGRGNVHKVASPQKVKGEVTNQDVDVLSPGGSIEWNNAYGDGLDFKYTPSDIKFMKILRINSLEKLGQLPKKMLQDIHSKIQIGLMFRTDFHIYVDDKPWNGKEVVTTNVSFRDNKGDTMLWWQSPLGTAADGQQVNGKFIMRKTGEGIQVSVQFPLAWLKQAQYPVELDPDTFNGTANDGYINGSNATYSTARSTSFSFGTSDEAFPLGQDTIYEVFRGFLEFNTSSLRLPVTQVRLYLKVQLDITTTDFTTRIHQYNWSSPLATGNRESNYDGALNSVYDADWRSSSGISIGKYYASSNLSGSYVDINGTTRYALLSSRDVSNTTPTNDEDMTIYSQDAASATDRPYLLTYYGGIYARIGSFVLNTGTGTQAITMVGFQPKGLILMLTDNNSLNQDNTPSNPTLYSMLSIGMSDGTNEFCVSSGSKDAAAGSDVGRRAMADKVICDIDPPNQQNVNGEADMNSFDADGFTINISNNFAAPASIYVAYIALGGPALTTYVGTVALNATSGQSTAVTAPNFEPEVVLTAYPGYFVDASSDTSNDVESVSFGWAINPNNQSSDGQLSIAIASRDNRSPTETRTQFDDRYAGISAKTDAIDASFEITSFASQGFSVTTRLANAPASYSMGYMALNFAYGNASSEEVKSIKDTASTSVQTIDKETLGWRPAVVLGIGGGVTTSTNTLTNGGSLSIGMADGVDQTALLIFDQDNVTTSNAASRFSTGDFLKGYSDAGGINWNADVLMQPNGFLVNWDDSAALANNIGFLAIGYGSTRQVYYSAGTNTNNLELGSGNVSITNGTATFTVTQADNIGVGDKLQAGGNNYYLSSRTSTSNTLYEVTTATGLVPIDLSSTSVTGIYRAFNTITTVEDQSDDASYLNSSDLTALNVQLNWPLYNDAAFTEIVDINGYTTSINNYIRIFAPNSSSDVGVSQRHSGKEGTGVRMTYPASVGVDVIFLKFGVTFAKIEGLEIDGSATTTTENLTGIKRSYVDLATDVSYINDVIIHDITAPNGKSSTGIDNRGTTYIRNTIIYDLISNTTGFGRVDGIVLFTGGSSRLYVYNSTVYNLRMPNQDQVGYLSGYYSTIGTMIVKNCYAGKIEDSGGIEQNNYTAITTQVTNVSSDATATGTSGDSKTDYSNYFVNSTSTNTDLHLKNKSDIIFGSSATDLRTDVNWAVTTDIDLETVDPLRVDFGADQVVPRVFYSVGTNTNNLEQGAGNVTITNAIATLTVTQLDNVGVGDKLQAGGNNYFIVGRTSNTQYYVETVLGAKPSDLASSSVTGIYRTFNSIVSAAGNSFSASYLNSSDITASGVNVQLNWPLYKDGDFNEANTLNYCTSDSTHYIHIYAPKDSSAVGASQRHNGKEGTGVRIRHSTSSPGSYYNNLALGDDAWIEGIEFDGSLITNGENINVLSSSQFVSLTFEDLLIHDYTNSTIDDTDESSVLAYYNPSAQNAKIKNIAIYDLKNVSANSSSILVGIECYGGNVNCYIANSTIFNLTHSGRTSGETIIGIESQANVEVKNTFVGKLVTSGSATSVAFKSINTQQTNVSSDTTATGTAGDSKTDYDNYFYNATTTGTDLRLKHDGNELWGLNGTDLRANAYLKVSTDIEGDARIDSTPDIGVDEVLNEVPNPPQTPYCEGSTTPVSPMTNQTPKFSAICDDQDFDACNYYEIEVDTASGFNGTRMWDTDKTSMSSVTENTRSGDFTYAGTAMTSGVTYYWRIRFWGVNTANGAGDWSATQQFTTSFAPNAAQAPNCESSVTPVSNVIDTTPEFSAIFDDNNTAATGEYYEIEVDTSSAFTGIRMWDTAQTAMTSCNENSRCADVSYAGTALVLDGQTFFWRIRFWNNSSLVGPWSTTQQFTMKNNGAPLPPQTPYCEGSTTPVTGVVDATPEFSAIYDDAQTTDTALYYEIEVDTSSAFTGTRVWDTGKTSMTALNENTRSTDVSYAGTTLQQDNSLFYWRIRFWDENDYQGQWSATQSFRMADTLYLKLAYTQQPNDNYQFDIVIPFPKVAVQTNGGVTNAGDNSTSITIAFAPGGNPGSAALLGTTTRTVSSGVATFDDLRITKAGQDYILRATAAGLTLADTSQ